jgi:hypothetical protein
MSFEIADQEIEIFETTNIINVDVTPLCAGILIKDDLGLLSETPHIEYIMGSTPENSFVDGLFYPEESSGRKLREESMFWSQPNSEAYIFNDGEVRVYIGIPKPSTENSCFRITIEEEYYYSDVTGAGDYFSFNIGAEAYPDLQIPSLWSFTQPSIEHIHNGEGADSSHPVTRTDELEIGSLFYYTYLWDRNRNTINIDKRDGSQIKINQEFFEDGKMYYIDILDGEVVYNLNIGMEEDTTSIITL